MLPEKTATAKIFDSGIDIGQSSRYKVILLARSGRNQLVFEN
jgi:hypothetical protein